MTAWSFLLFMLNQTRRYFGDSKFEVLVLRKRHRDRQLLSLTPWSHLFICRDSEGCIPAPTCWGTEYFPPLNLYNTVLDGQFEITALPPLKDCPAIAA